MCELNLWGIETSLKRPATLKLALCELNLWGIETDLQQSFQAIANSVWIEPVRDWNISGIAVNKAYSPCVNWTCEGLKRKISILNFTKFYLCELNLWGIETWNLGLM